MRIHHPIERKEARGGFTLVELMVALALAAMISVAIMVISNQAQEVYNITTRKVEVYNKFRFALLSIERDFSQWIPTSNMEFFIDGKGAGGRRNENWDSGEEFPDTSDKRGPGVVDGGIFTKLKNGEAGFDEFAYILERHYIGTERTEGEGEAKKVHDAYQAYFRTCMFIDGRTREVNVEYRLLDPNTVDEYGNPQPPTEVPLERMKDLSLYKIVRYHDIGYGEIEKPSQNFPILRKYVEVGTNITDFRIEYTASNRFDARVKSGFRTPREDSRDGHPTEEAIAAEIPPGMANLPGGPAYLKRFGYGSMKIQTNMERATAYRGIYGDRQLRTDHRPVRFGFQQNPRIKFAELTPGDKILIVSERSRGGAQAAAATSNSLTQLLYWDGTYTVKTNISGMLELREDIDSTAWTRDQPGIYYKAAFLPEAVRITIRVLDDTLGQEAKTMQRVVWIRQKSR